MKIIPVILCGGSGTRLWPESREDFPKQFLKLVGENSLLQDTLLRAARVSKTGLQDMVCVSLDGMADKVLEHIREMDQSAGLHILREPSARNTAAAVALAALYCQKEFGSESLIWVLPSDHYIGKEDVLGQALDEAKASAATGKLVTFGITPTRPETGYGYIKCARALPGKVSPVESFVEKPDISKALSFLSEGNYLWNSGMFLFRTSAVLEAFGALSPDILQKVQASVTGVDMRLPKDEIYENVTIMPFDKAIMEKSSNVTVIPCDIGWSDVGTWGSIWDISPKTPDQNVVSGKAVIEQTTSCLIHSHSGRLVACAGVENLVVIDTPDAVLITCLSSSDPLKNLVEKLKDRKSPRIR